MTMRSPIVAMLWENWRLMRVEAAQRTGLSIVMASGALLLFDAAVTAAYLILIVLHCMPPLSILKLNGGRLLDGYKPGFPFHLLYARPVPTAAIVGVAMVFNAVVCTALYLVSAALVGFAFDEPLPLFSVTVWLAAFHLVCTWIQWSTRSRVVQWLGSIVICLPLFFLLRIHRVPSPLHVEFSLVENALMALLGIVAVGLTVAGVARQRRGDSLATGLKPAGSVGYPDWLIALFRFPCPTSSATSAQMWFELRSSELPALAIGLAIAMVMPLLFAISIPFAPVRPFVIFGAIVCVPALLFFVGGNAFGIRHRQGRKYFGAFEATQPFGTAQLAGLKMLVRTACVLAALALIAVSLWASSSLVSSWAPWMIGGKEATTGVLEIRHSVARQFFEGPTGNEHFLLPFVAIFAIAMMIASRAAFAALRARYTRRVNVAIFLLLFSVAAFVLLALAVRNGIVSDLLRDTLVRTTGWIAAAALLLTTIYLLWSGFAERVLTAGYMWGTVVISAAFAAALLTGVYIEGQQLDAMSATNVVLILSLMLMPLMLSVSALWSLSRIRHT